MNGAELISEKATIESLAEVGGSMRVCYVQEAHAFLKEASFLAGPPGKNHRHEFFPEFWLLWCIITWQLTDFLKSVEWPPILVCCQVKVHSVFPKLVVHVFIDKGGVKSLKLWLCKLSLLLIVFVQLDKLTFRKALLRKAICWTDKDSYCILPMLSWSTKNAQNYHWWWRSCRPDMIKAWITITKKTDSHVGSIVFRKIMNVFPLLVIPFNILSIRQ